MKISLNNVALSLLLLPPTAVNAAAGTGGEESMTSFAGMFSCVYNGYGRQHMEECGIPLKIMTKGHDIQTLPFDDLSEDYTNLIKGVEYTGYNFIERDYETPLTKTVEQFIQEATVDGMAVLKNGKLVFEEYYNTQTPDTRHMMFSATKSFLGIVAAWLVKEGLLDEQALVTKYLPQLPVGNGLEGATVRNVMDMSTEFQWDEEGSTCDVEKCWTAQAQAVAANETVTLAMSECFGCEFLLTYNEIAKYVDYGGGAKQAALNYATFGTLRSPGPKTFREVITQIQPLVDENNETAPHGEKYTYRTMNTDVLAWIVDEVLAMHNDTPETTQDELLPPTADKFFAQKIWSKLGQDHDAFISIDSDKTPYWGAGSAITIRDALRYGEMMRLGGKNNRGEQVIPSDVVEGLFQVDEDPEIVLLNQLQFNKSNEIGRNAGVQGRNGFTYRNMHRIIPGRILWQEGFWGNTIFVDRQNDLVIVLHGSNENFAYTTDYDSLLFSIAEAFEKGLLPEVPSTDNEEVVASKSTLESGLRGMSSSGVLFSPKTAASLTFSVTMIISCLSMML